MIQKPMVAAVVFAATLMISLGCPQQQTPPRETSSSGGSEKTDQTPAAKVPVAPKVPADDHLVAQAPSLAKPAEEPPAQISPRPFPRPAAGDPPVKDQSAGAKADDSLFKDWTRPKAVIVATGMQMGYIEPCGCSGKENQKGGLSRRHNMLKALAAKGWPLCPVDVGEQVRRFGKEQEIKFGATADALKTMGYLGTALGVDDLKFSGGVLVGATLDAENRVSPFVMANVVLFDNPDMLKQFRVVNVGGLKLGMTAVLGEEAQQAIHNTDLKLPPAEQALADILPKLKAEHCDRLLLLVHGTIEESEALAKKFPEFDFVITSGGAPEPPAQPKAVRGTKTWLIEVGQKGMYANAIGLFDDPRHPVRFQRLALDAHWGESDDMKRVMAAFQDQLQQLGLDGLGLGNPPAHPSGRTFVGAEKCGECHTKAFDFWKHTPHAHALDTLTKLDPARNFDPECLSCHVTGWDPEHNSPYRGGYQTLDATPKLAQNGCENCHGPGSAHVAAEEGAAGVNDKQKAGLRAAMHIAPEIQNTKDQNNCRKCHDGDNSLNFKFETYWPKVEHKGKD